MNKKLDFDNPKTFTEKIQWLKLYNRRLEFTRMVDKYAVKDWVAQQIGDKYIIPTLGCWNSFSEIDFNKLPNKFVLKTTHGGGSGGVVICQNKQTFDMEKAQKRLEASLASDIYRNFREWPYKDVPRRILAEQFISEPFGSEELKDYKFYCFNGIPTYCQVIANRYTKETIDFFDMEWNHQEFYGLNPLCGPAAKPAAKPAALGEMIEIASKLSTDIPFLRVDLYEVNGRVYFGETTFFPASGFGVFTPMEWDRKLGEYISLF